MPLEIERKDKGRSSCQKAWSVTLRFFCGFRACVLIGLPVVFAGCSRPVRSAPDPLVRSFGVHRNPSSSLVLHITRSGTSVVDFKVVPSTGGSPLVSDSVGSDAMRWFFFWESPDSLWAYGSDTGYFCNAVFPAGGKAVMTPVTKGASIPREVWSGLPESKRASYVASP